MDDFVYIEQFGKPSFSIDGDDKRGHIDEVFRALNDRATRVFDDFWESNEVDSFDASCNTCRHFLRKSMSPIEKADRNVFGMPGHCAKKDVPTRGWQRGQFCGFDNVACYENRRTGMQYPEACHTVPT